MLRPLPTPWNVYNLAGSPYFQEPLESGSNTPRPLSLFVGRQSEVRQLRNGIRSAFSSRQAIGGAPGVGKTTLVKELKALAIEDGFLTTDALIPILTNDTTESLFGRVLSALYDTIVANRPQSVDNRAVQDAQILVRAARLGTGGGNVSVFGFGAGLTRGITVVTPKDIMIDGPRVMRDLMTFVQESDARGVLLHLNNLENLSESDAQHAAEILRDLRDLMLSHNGLHFVIVGTMDAVTTVVSTHPQVRNIVSTLMLAPLATAEVHLLLLARYRHLRLDTSSPAVPPADDDAVAALHDLFRGDLRGLLKALEDGVGPLIGLAGTDTPGHATDHPAVVRPLTIAELRVGLQHRYATHLSTLPEQKRVRQLTQWGELAPDSTRTQKALGTMWGVTQGAVSTAVTYFIRQGYVLATPRQGAQATEYRLSGVSRLIFG